MTDVRWVAALPELFEGDAYFDGPRDGKRIRVRIRVLPGGETEVILDSAHSGTMDRILQDLTRGTVEKVPCG